MKLTNLGYLIKEGVRGIFLHGFMSLAAVVVTVACLLIVGSFSCLVYNVNVMVDDLNKTNEVLAFVDDSLTDAEARSIGTIINQIPNVHKAEFVHRDKAWESFVADHGNDPAFDGVDPKTTIRHRFMVTLEDNDLMKETAAQLESITGIDKVNAAYEIAKGFSTIKNVLHIASVAVIGVLLIVSLLIISNTVKLAMYDRKDEISIMKMVGATNGFIRLPFVVEGFILGMVGAMIAFFLEWAMYNALVEKLTVVDTLHLFSFVPFTQPELMQTMVATFVAAGLFVGVVGSWTSIRKFMDV
ncbi:MAG: permease-like cell division protein FtsX [Oscillospiraceae bacterium]|nr:permease-like cell division protein FtsX [Oscillospiraceae bacterium]